MIKIDKKFYFELFQWMIIPLIILFLVALHHFGVLRDLLVKFVPFVEKSRADLMIEAFAPIVKAAFIYSVPLTIFSFVIGLAIALLVALIRILPNKNFIGKLLFGLAKFYISIIRGTPILVQLMIVFYGLPAMGIYLDPLPTAIIGFSLNVGAYTSETIRAAILSVPKGQWEAGFSVGMNYRQTFIRIILPQAFKVSIPPLSNSFIDLFKTTAIASTITITELFRTAQQIANNSYDFLPLYIEAALIYWSFCYFLFLGQKKLENSLEKSTGK